MVNRSLTRWAISSFAHVGTRRLIRRAPLRLSICDPCLHLGEIPNNTARREKKPLRELASTFHLIDGRIRNRYHFSKLRSTYQRRRVTSSVLATYHPIIRVARRSASCLQQTRRPPPRSTMSAYAFDVARTALSDRGLLDCAAERSHAFPVVPPEQTA